MTEQQSEWVIKPDMVSVYWSKEQVAQSWDIWEDDEIIAECPDEGTAQRIVSLRTTQARRIEELEAALRITGVCHDCYGKGRIWSRGFCAYVDCWKCETSGLHEAARALLSPSSKEVQG